MGERNRIDELLSIYEAYPFARHPLWTRVMAGKLTPKQVFDAETQHYLRTKIGVDLRRKALEEARAISPAIFELLLKTYLEECTRDVSGPSHLELIERLLLVGGRTKVELASAEPTPGNAAAVALYAAIAERGAGCHMLAAGAVEYYYSQLSPKIFDAYTGIYNMSTQQAETYRVHGSLDRSHAERAFSIVNEAIELHGWRMIYLSVRDAFVATSLHYDGMLQAATNQISYWDGKST